DRRIAASLLLTAMLLSGCQTPTRAPDARQSPERITVTVKQEYQYLRYAPADYGADQSKRWPLVLFLHGAGERGHDLELVKKHGLPKRVEQGAEFPFVMIAPQCPPGEWWNVFALEGLIEEVAHAERIDRDRIYLTGLSMGGFGTWALALRHPERYAAILPVCGGGERQLARRLREMPIWAFHGDADQVVPVERSQEMIDAIKKLGGSPRFTAYPGVGHDSWTATYDDPEVYEWLLAQRRGGKLTADLR
ncbi:MAG TPA: dienelactone hydrolase family protein, partial [Opitutus sp.]|nr:dienelactone hydrolase family protein [Opitutus sp.]